VFKKLTPFKFSKIGLKSDLGRLVLSGASRNVAITLIHLFSPVYIFIALTERGVDKKYSILFVLTYYFLSFLIKILTQIVAEDLSRKIGFKEVIRFSLPPFLFFVISLLFAAEFPVLFLVAAIFSGVHMGLFWWGYHGYFVKKGEKRHYGRTIGEVDFLQTVVGIVTPFLGSLVTLYFGFPVLFILAVIFMSFSILLLGKGSKTRQFHDVAFFDVLKTIAAHKSISLAYIGMAGEGVISGIIWPMFLYLFFGKLIDLGLIVTLSALIAAIFAMVIGEWADRIGERKIVKLGTPVLFFSWVIRQISFSFVSFVFADSMRNFGRRMIAMPLAALSYKKARDGGSAKAILFYEITQTIGLLLAIFLVSLTVLIRPDLSLSFTVASFLSLLPIVAVFKKRLVNANE